MTLALLFSTLAFAYTPTPEMISSPALLVNYPAWVARGEAFNAAGSETRAFRDLVEILYDHDVQRPWGDQYFPEANKRLAAFRAGPCKAAPVRACFLPVNLLTEADVTTLEQSLQDPASLTALGARFQLAVVPFEMPGREPSFSLVAGAVTESVTRSASFWDLSPTPVKIALLSEAQLSDSATYLAGFEQDDAPALFTVSANSTAAVVDFKLRDRAMDFATRWKHAIYANKSWAPSNPIADDKERQLQRLFDEQGGDFTRVYAEQLALVQNAPDTLARFQRERAAGDYPEETYQRVAYDGLRELVLTQADYFTLAAAQRKQTSPRQQALESLLALQRYSSNPRWFAFELTTLMEPLSSNAAVLDESADFNLMQVFTLDMLKALLGIDEYAGKPLFPQYGKGLLAPILFDDAFLTENMPDVKQALAGRDFTSLSGAEQRKILALYLTGDPGAAGPSSPPKVRMMGLFRLSAAWLDVAGADELRVLAERVHEVRKGNFH